MRLKGGKVLLDLTSSGDLSVFDLNDYQLSEEVFKAILEKGLIIQIIFNTIKIDFEPIIRNVNIGSHLISFYSLYKDSTEYGISINTENLTFNIVEQ